MKSSFLLPNTSNTVIICISLWMSEWAFQVHELSTFTFSFNRGGGGEERKAYWPSFLSYLSLYSNFTFYILQLKSSDTILEAVHSKRPSMICEISTIFTEVCIAFSNALGTIFLLSPSSWNFQICSSSVCSPWLLLFLIFNFHFSSTLISCFVL
jgi:hypothetical protein